MCNIAGYVGRQDAAPILIRMIRMQEGLNGGFYTGIAVHDGEKLHYRKTLGALETLLKQSDAAALKGTMGIVHSRTPSGGDGSWAHPFVHEADGIVDLCYVANGGLGQFKHRREEYNNLCNELIASGTDIPCKLRLAKDLYCKISDGSAVHMSDVMCQLIYQNKAESSDTLSAMTRAFCRMPAEIVGLSIEKESCDRIYFSRINKTMFLAFDPTGAYLASSPYAFPDSVKEFRLLPALSSGVVYRDRVELFPYPDFPQKVRGICSRTVKNCKRIFLDLLKTGEQGFVELKHALDPLFPKGELNQADALVYLALFQLLEEKKIEPKETQRVAEGMVAPKTVFVLAEKKEP